MPYPYSSLQTSGAISLNDLATEFDDSTPNSLSEFLGSDIGVPASGQISLSNFYGKQGPFPGGLWAFGQNLEPGMPPFVSDFVTGALGTNNSTNYSSPVQVGGLTNWKILVTGGDSHTSAIKPDGTLWAWGVNNYGQLGLNNNIVSYSSPIQVGGLTNWKTLGSSGTAHIAIKTDGTLWSWGLNNFGQLGLSNTVWYSSPIQVGGLTNWKTLGTPGSSNHNAVIKTDGTLWSWGLNNDGQLGLNNITRYSSPIQVGGLTNWKNVAIGGNHTSAIKTDGTLWSWGFNNHGQLGLNNRTNYSSPVQVGGLTNWKIIISNPLASLAIKTDGTLWAWGLNSGQLGTNNLTNYSSPVQVGGLTNWKNLAEGGYSHNAAIKTDGTLWSWGMNNYGQLGTNNLTNYSSPVQVGGLTNWKNVATGFLHTSATK
jgi:alpha-tubulin suppressor-like RCC1 family protein